MLQREIVVRTRTESGAKEVVLLEEGDVYEYKKEENNLVGNIYAARVTGSVGGFDASFADIGMEKCGFIKGAVMSQGELVLVQVVTNEHHDKGVSLSSIISMTGIYNVLMLEKTDKKYTDIKISKNVEDENRKEELHDIGRDIISRINNEMKDISIRIILRTDSEKADNMKIINEAMALFKEYAQIERAFKENDGNPRLLKKNDDIITEMITRYPFSTFNTIYTDDPQLSVILSKRYNDINIKTLGAASGYNIFDLKQISVKLIQLTARKVWLKSGSYILIEPTEAMTVIDINAGKHKGLTKREKEETAYDINKEAAKEIMRQLRLRNIGGIIICDFIDMSSKKYEEELLEYMKNLSKNDFERPNIIDITKLGLVEITRKRS